MLGTRYMVITKRISTLQLFKSPILNGTVIGTLRYNSTKSTTTTNSGNTGTNSSRLKPSSFAFPSAQPPSTIPSTNDSTTTLQQEDINDFKATNLIHGQTNLSFAITERASKKLNEISQQDNEDSGLIIQVESGGCHGFQYNLKLTNIDKELQEVENNDDLMVFERDQGKVIMNESSLMILQDSKLDYTKELIGSQFKIVDSPYTSSACGCGSSFDFDFDKLSQKEG
ncbi:iron sulfur assembly protein, putative [Candida dubliniensis CD36]|uniref:Iron sulfur assembly protein, putative n=1 Tax=Candida dubliniensis (strain CD36 / ATCC MYA-646 / CBS 7987 / NCPF 3949 / NRRL Y-17841) TaxID=573826 RepID=B9WER9_CANDC|nr:iron sulfur assembly protein, putative [Candida dubliniensis CD36]CAX43181.1 iron sulfur assembly protein, putative [Candida dubliniensis CD36]